MAVPQPQLAAQRGRGEPAQQHGMLQPPRQQGPRHGRPGDGRSAQLATPYIPAVLAGELPVLAARDTGPGGIYDRMEEAGLGPIEWTEAITTRPRHPRKPAGSG